MLNGVDSFVFEEDVMDEKEISNAVNQISKETSPGLDGLTAECYNNNNNNTSICKAPSIYVDIFRGALRKVTVQ